MSIDYNCDFSQERESVFKPFFPWGFCTGILAGAGTYAAVKGLSAGSTALAVGGVAAAFFGWRGFICSAEYTTTSKSPLRIDTLVRNASVVKSALLAVCGTYLAWDAFTQGFKAKAALFACAALFGWDQLGAVRIAAQSSNNSKEFNDNLEAASKATYHARLCGMVSNAAEKVFNFSSNQLQKIFLR